MLDFYVESPPHFLRSQAYILGNTLPHLQSSGVKYRVLDRLDPQSLGRAAVVHVDLTDLPPPFEHVRHFYERCLNGRALSIHRRAYSRALLTRDSDWCGPVIVKSALNHRGLPELRFAMRRGLLRGGSSESRRCLRERLCPPYGLYASLAEVPQAAWHDPALVVERFLPGRLETPVVKHRYDFMLDVELHTCASFDSLLCEPESMRRVDFPHAAPDAVRALRAALHLDFGSIDYFMVEGEAWPIDANKTTTFTRAWADQHPEVARFLDAVSQRLEGFARGQG